MVDVLFVIIELFRYLLRLRHHKRKPVEIVERKFETNHSWYQKTRVIALLCDIKISAVHRLALSQSTRVTDGQN